MDPLRLLRLRPHPPSVNSVSEILASPGSPSAWHQLPAERRRSRLAAKLLATCFGFAQDRRTPSQAPTPNTAHRRRTMKGVVFLGDRKLELREFPDPAPGPRDVILAIKASGMCGSDLHTYRAPANPGGVVTGGIKRAAGVIAGHEPCGVVAAVGSAVTDKEARIGQRVMDHHYDGCGNCKHCRAGWTQMCLEGPVVYGSGGHGGHAKYMKVPVSTLVPL